MKLATREVKDVPILLDDRGVNCCQLCVHRRACSISPKDLP